MNLKRLKTMSDAELEKVWTRYKKSDREFTVVGGYIKNQLRLRKGSQSNA